jgi:hypothetical protein
MTLEELDALKHVLKQMRNEIKELWLEKQILRNLIVDSNWMSPDGLDLGLEQAKKDPLNIRDMDENFAASDQTLAEIGLPEWLEALDRIYPRSE